MAAAAFPRHTFPLAADPAFDALDFGVAGRLLARGGILALQNGEGLALDLAAAGPLTRVRGPTVCQAALDAAERAATKLQPRCKHGACMVSALRRNANNKRERKEAGAAHAHTLDDDGEFGDDEKDAGEPVDLVPAHLHEGVRGNLACALHDAAGRVFLAHAGGTELQDLDVSRLHPQRRGRTWQLTCVARSTDSFAAALHCLEEDHDMEDGAERPGAKNPVPHRLVQITAESYDTPEELAWIAARSRHSATLYRLRDAPSPAGAQPGSLGNTSVSIASMGRILPRSSATASSVVLNPHWGGEAALLDSTAQVCLWNADVETPLHVGGPGPDLNAQALLSHAPPFVEAVSTLRQLALDYGQLVWGMHPRTLMCAQAYRLSTVDLRAPRSQVPHLDSGVCYVFTVYVYNVYV